MEKVIPNWKKFRLEDLLESLRNGFSGQQVEELTEYRVTRIETISDGEININRTGFVKNIPSSYKLQINDILLSNINSLKHIGKVAFVEHEEDLYHGMNLLLLKFNQHVCHKFLYYYLIWRKGWFEQVATQAINQASINQATLKKFELVIPSNKSEQQKIAEILSKVDKAIAQTEALIEKYNRIKTGLMQDLLTKGIDEQGNIRSEVTHEFKDSQIGRIPKEWDVVNLGSIIEKGGGFIQTGPFGSQLHAHEYILEGTPVVMPQDIILGKIVDTQISTISEKKALSLSRHFLKENDLVLARRGDLSKCAVINKDYVGAICGTGCLLIRSNSSINSNWLSNIYQFHISQTEISISAVGSTMQNLNTTILQKLPVFKVCKKEQDKIINSIELNANTIQAYQAQLSKLQSLKIGLMQDLLSGKVRVNHLLQH